MGYLYAFLAFLMIGSYLVPLRFARPVSFSLSPCGRGEGEGCRRERWITLIPSFSPNGELVETTGGSRIWRGGWA